MTKKKKVKHRSKENEMRLKLCKALRLVWVSTTKRDFIKDIRQPNRGPENFRFRVTCRECRKTDGITEKYHTINADGRKSKKPKIWFNVDHRNGIEPLVTLDDLTPHAKDLFFGEMQILCINCHKKKTKEQKESKNEKSKE